MIGITGATGHLGQLTINNLLQQDIDASKIVALVRSPEKAANIAALGVQVRHADYQQPETLQTALKDITKLLLISSSDFHDRIGQHRNMIQAAQQNSVELLAYTSVLKADTSSILLAADHKATEQLILNSKIPYVFLRNGWYFENYNLTQALEHGAILGSAGNGRLSAASRADYAAAAAAVLVKPDQQNKIYELGNDTAFSLSELAAELQTQSGKPVTYQNMPLETYTKTLGSFGLPDALATIFADSDRGIEQGDLFTDRKDLSQLIGKPTTTLSEFIRTTLQQ